MYIAVNINNTIEVINIMNYIIEPEKKIPVCAEADLCVVGGSCTGVFAAVRAARMGAKVVLIEKLNSLGGVATNGLVNVWHTTYDIEGKNQIIAGLTWETMERMFLNDSPIKAWQKDSSFYFNPEELKIELDNYIKENNIKLYLHSFYSGIQYDGDTVTAVLIDTKEGRRAIKAGFFIDATGDGDLARDLNIESYRHPMVQPPSPCFLLQGNMNDVDIDKLYTDHGKEFNLDDDLGWYIYVPGCDHISMRADMHVYNVLCDRADDLTKAEMEGRQMMRGFVRMLRKYGRKDTSYSIVNACSSIGIRDSRHYRTRHCVQEMDLLLGKRYEDAVINGTYNIDIHHSKDGAITFKDFDGSMVTCYGKTGKRVIGNWREELGITDPIATYYQVPFRFMVGDYYRNFIAAGRMLNSDMPSFGALRVMVNLNQMGEAAGVAAYLCLNGNIPLQELDGVKVRKALREGGSAL